MNTGPITEFEQWYTHYELDPRDGSLLPRGGIADPAARMQRMFERYKREMQIRVANYGTLEKLGAGEVISPKPDLPNISSGETAGLVRRIARNLVQNTPNVEVISKWDDDKIRGIFIKHILTSKIIGSDEYSNDMQQNLFASTKTALILGFDAVVPVLLQDAGGGWYMKYDSIHYRDVFPEPGCKDVRQATDVFIRRYLTEGEIKQIIAGNVQGWDHNALKAVLKTAPNSRQMESVDHETKRTGAIPTGYEIITYYSSDGAPFLTFSPRDMLLLRIEKNKHPLKQHPVHFLVLEKDDQQPLGKSQVELLVGRQDFQDLMLNGAMKLWYRNINPSIIGYGTVNSIPNLSPGKYTEIANPNAKIEAFEVNTGTLMQYGQISQQNLGSMVSLVGAADQQMAAQTGNGMSATPQGVDAQQAMVDITTNNYQKAIEAFFSHYCSYALTIFFQELKTVKGLTVTADARQKLVAAGLDSTQITEDGSVELDFAELCQSEYFVRCIPGSLVELEDEKQIRLLNELFIPLSQAMPALANSGDQQAIQQASRAMQYIIQKQIELSGAAAAEELKKLWTGQDDATMQGAQRIDEVEQRIESASMQSEIDLDQITEVMAGMQQQMSQMHQVQSALLEKLGVLDPQTAEQPNSSAGSSPAPVEEQPTVLPASA